LFEAERHRQKGVNELKMHGNAESGWAKSHAIGP